jgi:hypothetical protein
VRAAPANVTGQPANFSVRFGMVAATQLPARFNARRNFFKRAALRFGVRRRPPGNKFPAFLRDSALAATQLPTVFQQSDRAPGCLSQRACRMLARRGRQIAGGENDRGKLRNAVQHRAVAFTS